MRRHTFTRTAAIKNALGDICKGELVAVGVCALVIHGSVTKQPVSLQGLQYLGAGFAVFSRWIEIVDADIPGPAFLFDIEVAGES